MIMIRMTLKFINYVQTQVDIEIKEVYCKYLQIYLK
jgi:hypothetical protein